MKMNVQPSKNLKTSQHTMKRRLLHIMACLLFSFGLIANTPANENGSTYPPSQSLQEIQEHINQAPQSHPRLFINQERFAALRESIKQDPLKQKIKQYVVDQADALLNIDPIERKLTGRRLLGQSRRCVKRVILLSMAFHLTGKQQYAQRCENEMLKVAEFKDWNPSHFLDVAEMTFAMAIGYDWLYHQLDDASREEIRTAIIEKGVVLPFETRHNGWVRSSNNWGQVCHGGLTAGALAVLEDEPELAARTVHNALQNVTHSMAAYAPKGSYPEGPGYWSYGTTYNVLLIDVLESVLGSDFGLSQAPGFSKTGQYMSLVYGPSGYTFNYADGGAGRSPEPALFWFASKYNRPDWVKDEPELFTERINRVSDSYAGSSGGRFLPMALVWMNNIPEADSIEMPLNWYSKGKVPITIHRSAWNDPNAVFVGLKAGSPSANHGQMDIGSFVMDADEVRWAMDLGAEGYHGIESRGMDLWNRKQDSDRWKIFRQQNYGHNTLVINGQLQIARNKGTIVQFSDGPKFPYSILDMSPVYEGQAESVKRGVALLPSNEVLIQDELTGLKPNSQVRWGMITPAKPGKTSGETINLQQSNEKLTLTNLSPQHQVDWKIINTEKPQNEWDSPNKGTCMVALEKTASNEGELTFIVLLTPGSCQQSIIETFEPNSLNNWAEGSYTVE